MRASTISKYHAAGDGSVFARTLGATIRQHRERMGMSQGEIGRPLSRAFISLVENGHISPSLASLVLISARLDLPVWELLKAVSEQMAKELYPCPPAG